MAFANWSDPSAAQTNTPAELQSREQFRGPDITGIVQAVIRNNALKREQQMQQQQQIQKAISDYQNTRDQEQLADYMSQYETNPDQSAQLAAMSPSARLKASQWTIAQDKADQEAQINDEYKRAQTQNLYANMGNPEDPLVAERRRQLIAEGKMREARSQFGALTGSSGPGIDAASQALSGYIPGQTPWPESVGATKITEQTPGAGPMKDKILDAWYRMQGISNPYQTSQPSNSGLASGAPTAAGAPGLPGQHSTNDPQVVAALDWVAKNKKDPRAPDVLRKLGYDPTEYLANLP